MSAAALKMGLRSLSTGEADALAEARKRWGIGARAWQNMHDWKAPYHVGVVTADEHGQARVVVLGRGRSWERAFLSADKRELGLHRGRRVGRKRPPLPQLFG